MTQSGIYNPKNTLVDFGFAGLSSVHWNYQTPELYEHSIARKEGRIAKGGALVVETGQHTGRSAADKYVVRNEETENSIWWDNNKPISPEAFELLKADMLAHAKGKELFVQDLYGGADPKNRIASRIVLSNCRVNNASNSFAAARAACPGFLRAACRNELSDRESSIAPTLEESGSSAIK